MARPSKKAPEDSIESAYVSAVARAILAVAARLTSSLEGPVGRRRLILHLRGNQAPPAGTPRDGFALLESHRGEWVEAAVDNLVEEELLGLEMTRAGGARISVTPHGAEALGNDALIPRRVLPSRARLGEHPEVEERLRAARGEIAAAEEVSAYVVFTNGILAELAARRPANLAELADIPGMGESRIRKYGKRILAEIRKAGGRKGKAPEPK